MKLLIHIGLILALCPVCRAEDPLKAAADVLRAVGVKAEGTTAAVTLPGYYQRLHALCIGINDYGDNAIPSLSYSENDARDMGELLRSQYGFADVRTLLGKEATRDGITNAVAEFFDKRRVSANDGVVIYYSGHGQTVTLPRGGEMGFIVPQDARIELSRTEDPSPYYKTCLAMDEVKKWRQLIPARHVLIVADSCYSGLLASDRSMPRPIGDALALDVCQILTAGTRGQKAKELSEKGHGAYTAKLLEALRTGAADLNKDGYVRASELGQYLKECLLEGQSPQSKVMDGEGDFVLRASRTYGVAQETMSAPTGEEAAVTTVQPSPQETARTAGTLPKTNLLGEESSPYLRSASTSPVHWLPWKAEYFRQAALANRPVLITIGAQWSRPSRDMDTDAFSDPETANIINASFVAIKVDADERPDLSEHYRAVYREINNQKGGDLPLTVFALPDGRAFECIGFMPAKSSGALTAMIDILRQAIAACRDRREDVVNQAVLLERRLGDLRPR